MNNNTNHPSTQPSNQGCDPTKNTCTGNDLSAYSAPAATSSSMIYIYITFGMILFALIVLMCVNAATLHKAKIKSSMNISAKTNLGLSY